MVTSLEPFPARLRSYGVVAILRAASARRFVEVSTALYESGVRALEVTLNSEGALDALRDIRKRLPDDAFVGAGTVTVPEEADAAVDAGAEFLITPYFRAETVERALERDVPIIPGTLTPREIVAAWEAGASAVKVFPASLVGGPSYIAAVRGPLRDIPLVPTGAVAIDEIPAYFRSRSH